MSALGSAASHRLRAVIHPDTTIGTVQLTVTDLARSRAFYEQAVGLTVLQQSEGSLRFGAAGERPLVALRGDASARPLTRRATGLYHLAILLPTRADLGFALARLAAAHWPLDGASDHLVSEALYLSDPDGNGIEIYRDRPRAEWRYVDGRLAMSTLPLDLRDIAAEVSESPAVEPQVPAGTRVGHVHLQVSDLAAAEAFYAGVLGFEVTVRGYPGALFLSAGGYHHHLGLNTWHSLGAGPPPSGAVGLRDFEITLPDQKELGRVLDRVREAGIRVRQRDGTALLHDPAGNGVRLRAA